MKYIMGAYGMYPSHRSQDIIWYLVHKNYAYMCILQKLEGFQTDFLSFFFSMLLQHVVVYCRGLYYQLDTCDSQGKLLSAVAMEKQIEWIMEDASRRAGWSFFVWGFCDGFFFSLDLKINLFIMLS